MNEPRTVACFCATFLKPEMHHIYRQLSALRGYRIAVLTQKRENPVLFPFVDLTVIPPSPWRWAQRIIRRQILGQPLELGGVETRRILRELDFRRAALLHIFFGNTGIRLLPVLRAPARQTPVVVSFHGADVLMEVDRPAHRRALSEVFAHASLILGRSRSLLDALATLGCPREKLRLNRTGIPLDAFPFEPRAEPVGGAFRVLQACRLIPKKGLLTSLRAFAQFTRTYPAARFTIAGEGPQEPELRALCGELNITPLVEFTGFLPQDRLRRLLYSAHFFVHPSEVAADGNQEGVPNSLLEAMSTGLAVLATTHGGIPEAIDHAKTGWLVPERDDRALGDALLQLAADPGSRLALGRAASGAVAERFSLDAQARALEDVYQEAIDLAAARGVR